MKLCGEHKSLDSPIWKAGSMTLCRLGSIKQTTQDVQNIFRLSSCASWIQILHARVAIASEGFCAKYAILAWSPPLNHQTLVCQKFSEDRTCTSDQAFRNSSQVYMIERSWTNNTRSHNTYFHIIDSDFSRFHWNGAQHSTRIKNKITLRTSRYHHSSAFQSLCSFYPGYLQWREGHVRQGSWYQRNGTGFSLFQPGPYAKSQLSCTAFLKQHWLWPWKSQIEAPHISMIQNAVTSFVIVAMFATKILPRAFASMFAKKSGAPITGNLTSVGTRFVMYRSKLPTLHTRSCLHSLGNLSRSKVSHLPVLLECNALSSHVHHVDRWVEWFQDPHPITMRLLRLPCHVQGLLQWLDQQTNWISRIFLDLSINGRLLDFFNIPGWGHGF